MRTYFSDNSIIYAVSSLSKESVQSKITLYKANMKLPNKISYFQTNLLGS
jgi:hypothetical protein